MQADRLQQLLERLTHISIIIDNEYGWHILRGRESHNLEPALVILDLHLPGINGFELCRRVRSEERLKVHPTILTHAGRSGRPWTPTDEALAEVASG